MALLLQVGKDFLPAPISMSTEIGPLFLTFWMAWTAGTLMSLLNWPERLCGPVHSQTKLTGATHKSEQHLPYDSPSSFLKACFNTMCAGRNIKLLFNWCYKGNIGPESNFGQLKLPKKKPTENQINY